MQIESAFPMYNELGNLRAEGLTKREYFAAKAMQGILASDSPASGWLRIETVAGKSIEFADELLKQLSK